jgi:hypothetical protein
MASASGAQVAHSQSRRQESTPSQHRRHSQSRRQGSTTSQRRQHGNDGEMNKNALNVENQSIDGGWWWIVDSK